MNQIATRDQGASREVTEYDRLRFQLDKRSDAFKMALPSHIAPEKFQQTVMTAVQSNPSLLEADRASLITSCMKAAQDGLLPDGREAAIVTFNTRKKDGQGKFYTATLAQYMPMVFGLRKKILQSGEISSIETNVVYRREAEEGRFIFEGGTEAMLRHRPMLDLTDEEMADENIVAAYSVATMKDGTKSFEVMRRSEINKVRQASQTGAVGRTYQYGPNKGKPIEPKGPWVDWFAEMARKTVMRRHSKTLPMSGDIIDVEAADEALAVRSAAQLLGSVDPGAPRLSPPPGRTEIPHDPVTGEIDEETARALDHQSFAQMDGTAGDDETASDDGEPEQEGTAGEDEHPAKKVAAELVERCTAAKIIGDVINVEGDLKKHRDAMPDELVAEVEKAIADARGRFGKAKQTEAK